MIGYYSFQQIFTKDIELEISADVFNRCNVCSQVRALSYSRS